MDISEELRDLNVSEVSNISYADMLEKPNKSFIFCISMDNKPCKEEFPASLLKAQGLECGLRCRCWGSDRKTWWMRGNIRGKKHREINTFC